MKFLFELVQLRAAIVRN